MRNEDEMIMLIMTRWLSIICVYLICFVCDLCALCKLDLDLLCYLWDY